MLDTQSRTGAAFLARTLQAQGVDHIFFVDAVLRTMLAHAEQLGIRRILAHSEKAAAYMADGYSRVTRRPSVCMAQSVGAANLASGLQDARFANSPVIAFTGRHVAEKQYRHAYQELPHQPMFEAVTKLSARVEAPAQLGHLVRHAFRVATSGRPGPVHLDVAGHTGDVCDGWTIEEDVAAESRHARVPAYRPRPSPEALAALAEAIEAAQCPVVVVGDGACWSGAQDALRALASKQDLPVACSLEAKALMAGLDVLDAGVTGTYGTDAANRLLAEADLAVFLGCDVGDQVTSNWKLPRPGVRTAHVGTDAEDLGLGLPGAITVLGDPATVLELLGAELPERRRREWLQRAAALQAQWQADHAMQMSSAARPIRPERLCQELGRWLPADATVVADTGFASQWTSQLLHMRHPGQQYIRAAGSLGWAFPASLGAKAAQPDRTVVCFTGDGGFLYHLPELETALRWGLNTITVVNNNGCLAQGKASLRRLQAGSDRISDCYQFVQQDFAGIAQAFGCAGFRVEDPAELPDALALARRAGKPAVVDVRTDPEAACKVPWMPS